MTDEATHIAIAAENARLRTALAEAHAALKPFSDAVQWVEPEHDDDYSPSWAEFFVVGDFRKAATVLSLAAAASLDGPYAALNQHLHEDPVNVEKTDRRRHFSVVEQFAVRWEPYKPDGRRQMKARGRWQRQVWRGDFFRWENCDRPDALFPADFDWRTKLTSSDRDAQVRREALEEAFSQIADYPRVAPSEDEWTRYDEQIKHSQNIIRSLIDAPACTTPTIPTGRPRRLFGRPKLARASGASPSMPCSRTGKPRWGILRGTCAKGASRKGLNGEHRRYCRRRPTMTTDHRSFPEAADGRPLPPMADELMSAGLSGEDARFVARMLRRDGYYLVRADDIGWPDIHRFRSVLGAGQDHREDAGGFFVRAIMALFGKRPDHVVTYRQAATALLEGLKDDQ